MPYIPASHQKYDLLPYCRAHGGEVFVYPYELLRRINAFLETDDHLDPYGYDSYEEYDQEIDRIVLSQSAYPERCQLLRQYKQKVHDMNQKEQWSVLRYLGPDDGRLFSLTPGRCYYWPSSYAHPLYSGVVNDEEYTSYFHPVDEGLWEILEDPTGMAYHTIHGPDKHKFSKAAHDNLLRQVHHAPLHDSPHDT